MSIDPKDRLIVALDVPDADRALALADALAGAVGAVKVGLELYAVAGPELVRRIAQAGHRVFLDLKFHDIPNTVAGAVHAASQLGAFMLNVHIAGGRAMLDAAARAVQAATNETDRRPLLIGVTVLTSLGDDDLAQLGISGTALDAVVRYAVLAKECALDGVVASAREASAIKAACGDDFLVVTPGIRPAGSGVADQKRVVTPADAVNAGADYLVVGRPIHGASDPRAAAETIVDQIAHASSLVKDQG